MARLLAGAAFGVIVGIVGGAALGIRAQTEPDPNAITDAAQKAGVPEIDLLGAVYTTGLDPFEYLYQVHELARPVLLAPGVPTARSARVRLTYYTQSGLTFSGGQTYPGSAACSWNFPLGTRFRFRDGEAVVCNDRGLLGNAGWLDVYANPGLAHKYGAYATVEVAP